MKPDIWMPLYIGDYIKDTQELSAEEHGAYLLLLMHYWLRDGEIGCDVDRLSRVTKCDVKTTQYILDTFFIKAESGYKNKRADEEIDTAKKRSEAARGNVSKRWDKQQPDTAVLPPYNDGCTVIDTESIPRLYSSSSSSHSSSKTNSKSKTRDPANAVSGPNPLYTAVWNAFLSRQPDKKFSDYGKEGGACKQLCKKIRARASPGDEMGLAEKIISCYYEYVMGADRFWSSQPFTPMGLNTGNRFDSVIKRVYEEVGDGG